VALAAAAWPFVFIAVVFFLPACVKAAVPRRWRVWYRRRHGREGAKSSYIPRRTRRTVYAMDRYRCVFCNSGIKIQADHIRPWRAGGLVTLWNLAVLCQQCNLVKSNYYDKPGFEMYRAWDNHDDRAKAAAIIARERRHRYSPLRWLRAAWALGAG
jgi:5-methylcytosine-specific restriction endonuclease McrA